MARRQPYIILERKQRGEKNRPGTQSRGTTLNNKISSRSRTVEGYNGRGGPLHDKKQMIGSKQQYAHVRNHMIDVKTRSVDSRVPQKHVIGTAHGRELRG